MQEITKSQLQWLSEVVEESVAGIITNFLEVNELSIPLEEALNLFTNVFASLLRPILDEPELAPTVNKIPERLYQINAVKKAVEELDENATEEEMEETILKTIADLGIENVTLIRRSDVSG